MQDIHKGFQDVNRATDAEVFFQSLDAADALESIQAYRQRMLDLCPPTVGQRILDVGCGIGHSALRLAPLVGATGCVVGLDKSDPLITEARRRATGLSAPLTYQVGDAQHLDFPPQRFDVCRTERVLMYVDNPQQALDEMLRIVRPGGMLVLFEFDYDGIVVDAPDQAFTRRLVRLVADSVRTWGASDHGHPAYDPDTICDVSPGGRPYHLHGFRAVVADQPGRYGHSEAVEVELATRVAALHLILERPTDILQLGVARLETISDLDPVWINPQFFRHPVQKRGRHAQSEECVFPFHLPGAWRVCREDMNIAVY
jgi:ubiquinone/menaquinone biosynthesis C-methylase UbiE